MRRARWTTLALAASFLAGCTVGPDYKRPEMALPENHRGLEGAAAEASLADVPWWDAVMGDEVLKGPHRRGDREEPGPSGRDGAGRGIPGAGRHREGGLLPVGRLRRHGVAAEAADPGDRADPDVQQLHHWCGRLVGDRPVGADPAVERVGAEPAAGDGRGAAGRHPVAGHGSCAGVPGAQGAGPGAGDRRADTGEPQGLLRPRVEEAPRGDLEQAGVVAGRIGAGADRGGDPAAQAGDLRQGEPAGAPAGAAAGHDPAREEPRRGEVSGGAGGAAVGAADAAAGREAGRVHAGGGKRAGGRGRGAAVPAAVADGSCGVRQRASFRTC